MSGLPQEVKSRSADRSHEGQQASRPSDSQDKGVQTRAPGGDEEGTRFILILIVPQSFDCLFSFSGGFGGMFESLCSRQQGIREASLFCGKQSSTLLGLVAKQTHSSRGVGHPISPHVTVEDLNTAHHGISATRNCNTMSHAPPSGKVFPHVHEKLQLFDPI